VARSDAVLCARAAATAGAACPAQAPWATAVPRFLHVTLTGPPLRAAAAAPAAGDGYPSSLPGLRRATAAPRNLPVTDWPHYLLPGAAPAAGDSYPSSLPGLRRATAAPRLFTDWAHYPLPGAAPAAGDGYPSSLPGLRRATAAPRNLPVLVLGAAKNQDIIPVEGNYTWVGWAVHWRTLLVHSLLSCSLLECFGPLIPAPLQGLGSRVP